jgi:hypothetical protein
MTCQSRRKLFHRVIFTRALAVRVTEIRRVTLFRWPWERPPFVTIREPKRTLSNMQVQVVEWARTPIPQVFSDCRRRI